MAFTGCSNDEFESAPALKKTISFSSEVTRTAFGEPDGTTYPTLWTGNEQIKIGLNNASTDSKPVAADVTATEDGKKATWTAEITDDESGSYTLYALSPASAYLSTKVDGWGVTIPEVQTPIENSCDEAAQILVAKSATTDVLPSNVTMHFKHLTAYGKLTLKNLDLGEAKVQSIALTAENHIVGRFNYDFASNEVSNNSGSTTLTINTDKTEDVWFAIRPCDLATSALKVVVTTDKGTFTKEVEVPEDYAFKAGVIAKMTINMEGVAIEGPEVWSLVSSVDEISVGDQVIIAAQDYNYAISTTQNGNNRGQAAIVKSDDKATATIGESVQVFTVENGTEAGTIAFNTGSGYIYAASSSNNYLKTQTTLNANASWTVTFDADATATLTAQGSYTRNILRYNDQSKIFSCYASGQKDVVIYKKGTIVKKIALSTPVVEAEADDTTITATWGAVENAASYTVVCRALVGEATQTQTVSETTCTFTNLKTATEYEISVVANPADEDETYKASEAGVVTVTTTGEAGFTTIAEIREAGVGTYNIEEATVIAKGATSSIIEDETGRMFVYTDLGLAEGDVVTLMNATITTFGDGLQVNAATVEKVGTATIDRGEPHVVLGSEMANYTKSYTACEYIEIEATLSISGSYLNFSMEGYTKTGSYISPSFDLTEWNGVPAIVTAYACYNNKSGYFYILPVSMRVADHISITPTSLSWGAAEVDAKTVTVTSNDDNWTIDETTVPDWATIEATNATTLTVTPTANEGAARYATVVIKHATNSAKVAELILSQDAAGVTSYVAEYILTNDGFANQKDISTVEEENGNTDLTVTFAKNGGPNGPKYYTSGTAVRIYSKNTLTIAGQEGVKIQQVKILYGSGYNGSDITGVSEGNITIANTDGTWICEGGSTVTLTHTGSNGNIRFQQIKVTYTK